MPFYQIGLLGAPAPAHRDAFADAISSMVEPFRLKVGADIELLDAAGCETRDSKAAFVAVYFGGAVADAHSESVARGLSRENIPIIPVVDTLDDFSSKVPSILSRANGLALSQAGPKLERLAAVALECLGLLRRQRRVFLSYRRIESAAAALQLHEALGARGFEVFLDTFDVRPGDDFQAVLWHRLCDSDVLVMLDTPGYFASRWTAAEFGRALAKGIAVLGVVWPGHTPQRPSQLRHSIELEAEDLSGPTGPFTGCVVEMICLQVECLRSRSIAIRHAALAGALRSAAEQIGASVQAVGAHRSMKLELPDGKVVYAVPAVGVPSAEIFHEVAEICAHYGAAEPVVVYDHVGLHERWQRHLNWLHEHLGVVKSLQIAQAAWQLADWET